MATRPVNARLVDASSGLNISFSSAIYWRATIAQAGSSRGRLLPDGLAAALDGVQALKVYGASVYA